MQNPAASSHASRLLTPGWSPIKVKERWRLFFPATLVCRCEPRLVGAWQSLFSASPRLLRRYVPRNDEAAKKVRIGSIPLKVVGTKGGYDCCRVIHNSPNPSYLKGRNLEIRKGATLSRPLWEFGIR